MTRVFVSGSFDDLRSRQVRFLEEAARLGPVWVLLWSDAVTQAVDGKRPKFSQAEREYFLNAIRYVERVILVDELVNPDRFPLSFFEHATWAIPVDHQAKSAFARQMGSSTNHS
jgi:glycerol-3-phosphate cytidylyltransferase-like family protein